MECLGLDVSVKTTSVCVMDADGAIVREGKAESSPEAIAAFLSACGWHYSRVGSGSRSALPMGLCRLRAASELAYPGMTLFRIRLCEVLDHFPLQAIIEKGYSHPP
jgi:hypothetical protein